MGKKWIAVEFNLSKAIEKKAKPERVKIPANITMQVIVDLEKPLYDEIIKNPTTLQRLQSSAKKKVDVSVIQVATFVKKVDEKATKFNKKTAKIFSNDLTTTLTAKLQKVSDEMAREAAKIIEDYKKGQKELKKFKVKCVGKIGVSAFVITSSVALTAASGATLSPLGITGIVKGGIGIVQEIGKLASTADATAKLIQGELAVLKKFMNENMAKAKKSGKIAQGVKEVGLNFLSGALGIETPSLRNCDGHVKMHKVNIAKLEKESKKLSESIYGAMDLQAEWAKKFNAAKKSLPAKKVGKISTRLGGVEKALDALIKATIKVNKNIDKANEQQKVFREAIDAMLKGIPGWLQYVDKGLNLVLDVSVGIVDAGTTIEKVGSVIINLDGALGKEVVDLYTD